MTSEQEDASNRKVRLALCDMTQDVLQRVEHSLARIAHMIPMEARELIDPHTQADAGLILIRPPHANGVESLARLRSDRQDVPIVVIGQGLDATHAVELIKCGAADFLQLPVEADVLRNKVERIFHGHAKPALNSMALKPLQDLINAPPPRRNVMDYQRRRGDRADVPPHVGARVELTGPTGSGWVEILDLSIPDDGWPGGIKVRCDAHTAQTLRPVNWDRDTHLKIKFDLPMGDYNLPGAGNPVPPVRVLTEEGESSFAVQYQLDSVGDAALMRKFWMICMDRTRRPTKPWLPLAI